MSGKDLLQMIKSLSDEEFAALAKAIMKEVEVRSIRS